MALTPQILHGHVSHKRLFPAVNRFTYSIYYLAMPLSSLGSDGRHGLYARDHGYRDGSDLKNWADEILKAHDFTQADGEIVLIAMPRVLGYVFNPVSFWLCFDKNKQLRAVIYAVNNTFGERHNYFCARPDRGVIGAEDVLEAEKIFHVSPFLEREGHYTFRISWSPAAFGVWIDYFDAQGQKKLVTSLTGRFEALTTSNFRQCLRRYPLVTFKAIALIHWQAIRLLARKVRYIVKPPQLVKKTSASFGIDNKNP